MKVFIITSLLAASSLFVNGQDFPFSKPTPEEFQLKRYEKDTTANAVVLREYGTAFITNNSPIEVQFEYHVRIKIFNANGFKHGNIEIPIMRYSSNSFQKISEIKAVTFYPDEQQLIRKTDLDPTQIFREKKAGKYYDLVKFAMPNLKPGAIIEYSYTLNLPSLFNFKSWEFQGDIPKIHSEFCGRIPGAFTYNVALRGPHKLSKTDAVLEKECFTPGGSFKSDCSKMTYIMTDVPAFVEEDYMTAAANFKSAMSFELSEYMDYTGVKHQVTKEWKNIDKELRVEERFGVQLKKDEFFKDKIGLVIAGKTTNLDKAQAIYDYIKSNYKWNEYYGDHTENGIKTAWEKKAGNVADINMSLITALRAAGITATPIILSTRSNGMVNKLFPVLSDFDYVICKADIDDKSFMLDATEPLLPFGLLPLRCLNGEGRLMDFEKGSSWIDINASQKKGKTLTMALELDESGKLKGNMTLFSSGYEALDKRKAIKKFASIDEFVESLDERYAKLKIGKYEIKNADSVDKSLAENYEIELNPNVDGKILVNPHFMTMLESNPFKLPERTYPVDMGSASETRINLQLKFPKSYSVSTLPKPLALALPGNGGRLLTQASVEGNTLSYSCIMQLNKPVYSSEEYYYLKELYNSLLKAQHSAIEFKKL